MTRAAHLDPPTEAAGGPRHAPENFAPASSRPGLPPPAPAARRPLARVLAGPVACLLLAAASVAAGAFVLPRLGSKPVRAESIPAVVILDGNTDSMTAAPDQVPRRREVEPAEPTPAQITRFDEPPVPPRLPSDRGPYAISRAIDRAIEARLARAGIPASPLAGDAEFLRRAHLDLIGKIPTRERAAAFLSDADPLKRSRLVVPEPAKGPTRPRPPR